MVASPVMRRAVGPAWAAKPLRVHSAAGHLLGGPSLAAHIATGAMHCVPKP